MPINPTFAAAGSCNNFLRMGRFALKRSEVLYKLILLLQLFRIWFYISTVKDQILHLHFPNISIVTFTSCAVSIYTIQIVSRFTFTSWMKFCISFCTFHVVIMARVFCFRVTISLTILKKLHLVHIRYKYKFKRI